jgi:hypothetical protein
MTMTAPTSAANRTRTRTRPADPDALEGNTPGAAAETERPSRARGRTRAAGSESGRAARNGVAAPETERPGRTRTRTRPVQPEAFEVAVPETGRRPRTAAAQRAYARRAQREGRAPERVATPADSAAGRASFVVLIIGLLVVGVATTLWLSTQAIADSYRLDEAKQAATDLSERAEVLQREVTKMDSLSGIDNRAKELGMVPPPSDPARLVVQPDGTVVVVGEPKAADAPAPPPPPAEDVEPAPPAEGQPPADGQAPPQRVG